MKHSVLLSHIGTTIAIGVLAAACESPAAVPAAEDAGLSRNVHSTTAQDELLRSVRQATARFNSTTQAIQAGYVPSDHCVAVPGLGGMGYHWVNPGLVDGTFDPLQPEMMLYAKGPGGNLRLIAVEYLVLAGEGQDLYGPARPRFGDRLLDVGGTPFPAPHWSLHVWLYEANPSGLFTPFNPNVSCD